MSNFRRYIAQGMFRLGMEDIGVAPYRPRAKKPMQSIRNSFQIAVNKEKCTAIPAFSRAAAVRVPLGPRFGRAATVLRLRAPALQPAPRRQPRALGMR